MPDSVNIKVAKPKISIDGKAFTLGQVLGRRLEDGTLEPTVEGVTRGHLDARLRFKELELATPSAKPVADDDEPQAYDKLNKEQLTQLIADRGLDAPDAKAKKADLIEVLEQHDADVDQQAQDAADLNA